MRYASYVTRKKGVISIIVSVILSVLLVPIVFSIGVMFYCNIALDYYPIIGTSMKPLLNNNDIDEDCVYVSNDKSDITYNDIIIYKRDLGNDKTKSVIKRVVAMAGDNFMIKKAEDGNFAIFIQYGGQGEFVCVEEKFITDKNVYEDMYVEFYDEGSGKEFLYDENGNRYLHIADDEIFYLGDNRKRSGSTDCLDYGAQKAQNIVGEVKYIIYKDTNRIWQILMQMFGFFTWK